MYCPDCGSEFRDGVERCADCGVPLVADRPDVAGETHGEAERLVVIDRFHDLAAAHLAREALAAAGIDAWLRDEQTLGVTWLMGPAIGGSRLAVRASDADAAREVLQPGPVELPPELEPDDPEEEARYARRSRLRKRAIGVLTLGFVVSPLLALVGAALAATGRRDRG